MRAVITGARCLRAAVLWYSQHAKPLKAAARKVTSFTCRVDKLLYDLWFRVEFTCLEQLVVFLASFSSGLTSHAFRKSDLWARLTPEIAGWRDPLVTLKLRTSPACFCMGRHKYANMPTRWNERERKIWLSQINWLMLQLVCCRFFWKTLFRQHKTLQCQLQLFIRHILNKDSHTRKSKYCFSYLSFRDLKKKRFILSYVYLHACHDRCLWLLTFLKTIRPKQICPGCDRLRCTCTLKSVKCD